MSMLEKATNALLCACQVAVILFLEIVNRTVTATRSTARLSLISPSETPKQEG